MRKLLLASAGMFVLAAPAFAGSPSQPQPQSVSVNAYNFYQNAGFAKGYQASGLNANAYLKGYVNLNDNWAISNTTTSVKDTTILVNPAEAQSTSGASYSLGAGATPAVWAENPNGTVGQLLDNPGQAAMYGSSATVSNAGNASQTSQSNETFICGVGLTVNGALDLTKGGTVDGGSASSSDGSSDGGNILGTIAAGSAVSMANTASTVSNSWSNGSVTAKGPGAYALDQGETQATGMAAAGYYENTVTDTTTSTNTGWINGQNNFNVAAGLNANSYQAFGVAYGNEGSSGFGFQSKESEQPKYPSIP